MYTNDSTCSVTCKENTHNHRCSSVSVPNQTQLYLEPRSLNKNSLGTFQQAFDDIHLLPYLLCSSQIVLSITENLWLDDGNETGCLADGRVPAHQLVTVNSKPKVVTWPEHWRSRACPGERECGQRWSGRSATWRSRSHPARGEDYGTSVLHQTDTVSLKTQLSIGLPS